MEILKDKDQWRKTYTEGLIASYNNTGQIDWKLYPRAKNIEPVTSKAVDLSKSRLLFISSAGGYLANEQQPFDAESKLGDYSIRKFASQTAYDKISYAHTHYDHAPRIEDVQVLMPLTHLQKLVDEKVIGELATSMISFMGYQSNVADVVDVMIPQILEIAHDEQVKAALLVPA